MLLAAASGGLEVASVDPHADGRRVAAHDRGRGVSADQPVESLVWTCAVRSPGVRRVRAPTSSRARKRSVRS